MIKMGFSTGAVDGWPPFEFEHIWLEKFPDYYKVMNTPFYLRGMCYEDEIHIESRDGVYVDSWYIVRESTNSTIWIMELRKNSFRRIIKNVQSLGCIVENGIPLQYYAITLPSWVDVDDFDSIVLKEIEYGRLSVSYSTIRAAIDN